jgi:hypothetical protein
MIYQPHPNVVTRELDGATVLVHLDTSRIFTLNPTGGRVWALLDDQDGEYTLVTLERLLGEDYDVDGGRLHDELVTLLAQLEEERLVIPRATAKP